MKPYPILISAILAAALMVSCGVDEVVQTSAPAAPAARAATVVPSRGAVETAPAPDDLAESPARFRQMAFDYWDAFNRYDVDAVLAFYEPTRGLEEEKILRRDIGLLKTFGATLLVGEKVPAFRNSRGEWEMLLLMQEPTGLRTIHMAWAAFDGQWLLIDASEVKE
ncbi:MAG: hypothetical protein O2803_13335 [Chloroflexi bacterium]|nr:hypothetical protein [Chloroflexota bacterium]